MKAYRKLEVKCYTFSPLKLDGGEQTASPSPPTLDTMTSRGLGV